MSLTTSEPSTPTTQQQNAEYKLVCKLAARHASECSSASYNLVSTPTPDDEAHQTAMRQVTPDVILGLVVRPDLEQAVDAWLQTRDMTLADISTGVALSRMLQLDPPKRLRHRLRDFKTFAYLMELPDAELPTQADIRLERNRPRVLRSIALVAQFLDRAGWAAVAPTLSLRPSWRDMAVDEQWAGDETARRLACLVAPCGSLIIAGRQGSGKSATLATLLGRMAVPASHALSVSPASGEGLYYHRMVRDLAMLTWPYAGIHVNIPAGSSDLDYVHVRLDGHVLTMLELPAMVDAVDSMGNSAQVSHASNGKFDKIVADLQTERAAVVVLTECLDDFDSAVFRKMAQKLLRLFGPNVIPKLLVVLTHGQALPPCDVSYDVWTFDQTRQVRDALRAVFGHQMHDDVARISIVLVENSSHCARHPTSGRCVLPNGVDFLQQFVDSVARIVVRTDTPANVKPVPMCRWWEPFLYAGVLVLFAIRSRY